MPQAMQPYGVTQTTSCIEFAFCTPCVTARAAREQQARKAYGIQPTVVFGTAATYVAPSQNNMTAIQSQSHVASFRSSCGTARQEGSKFCGNCGAQ